MLSNQRVLKFPLSEKVFHNLNLVTWTGLAVTGVLIYFKLVDEKMSEILMDWHIGIAIVFTMNFFGFMFLNFDRFSLMLRNLFIWDKDTFAWFKNFGGYPRRLFGIKFGPEEVAPQGRFNAGQKATYIIFMFMIFALIVTGWLLYAYPAAIGKVVTKWMFVFHVWASILTTLIAFCAHMPLALINIEDFKAMFRFGPGDVPLEDAYHHAPKWVKEDLISIDGNLKTIK
ncbi:cytochrome b/b6 domain-containing protein [Campylobacter pinnipediorum]|uniref:cytochrome b/b6 domain-containing protein n=1 Tax=Campylobacter pinnipediorum TaxID=1965231 RepID=UPI00084DBE44|nr:cytochrome b/b6 domain-containing protein [Campylobacter pinnipediorum]